MAKRTQLVRNAERALGLRKRTACVAPSLGTDVSTPSSFLAWAWDLWGDERNLIDSASRTMLMLKSLQLLALAEGFPLSPTVGTAKLLGAFQARYAGTEAFDASMERISAEGSQTLAGFPPGQAAALLALAQCGTLMAQSGLIEPASAARKLSADVGAGEVICEEPLNVAPATAAWLEAWGVPDVPASPIQAPDAAVHLRFAFTTGATGIIRAVHEEIAALLADATGPKEVVVFAPDARGLLVVLAPSLAEEGICAACQASVPFFQTDVGCALLCVAHMKRDEEDWRPYATDLARTRASGMTRFQAQDFDASLRRDALMTRAQAEDMLREQSPTFTAFESLVETATLASFEALRDAVKEVVSAEHSGRSLSPEDEAAFALMERTFSRSAACGAQECALEVLGGASVTVSEGAAWSDAEGSRVTFLGMDRMDALAPESVDAVIFADMTKGSFAIPAAKPSTDGILRHLGLACERDPAEEMRSAFMTALSAAREALSFISPWRSPSGDQCYPSFIYDELLEALSSGNLTSVDSEGLFRVPADVREDVIVIDESDIVQGLGQEFSQPERVMHRQWPIQGALQHLRLADLMRRSPVDPTRALISASQLEMYLHCPYAWFIANKVGIQDMDEVFDSAHKGTFMHKVYQHTFDTLASEGIARVTQESLGHVREVAARTFDALMDEQASLEPGRRCVVADERSESQMQVLRREILASFAYMAQMPAGYDICAEELKLEPEDGIEYAGAMIQGSVDRVDMSEEGRFAVLDYKGAITVHEAGVDDGGLEALPNKVQALIYAQALTRTSRFAGMACVGALYLSYKATAPERFSAGSYDAIRYDMSGLSMRGKSSVSMDFQEFLARIEEMIAPFVTRMMEGDIAPTPHANTCLYCRATFCKARQ